MKIILDECLPRRLVRDLHPYLATTVPREGWAGIKNGVLLQLIISAFDVFITLDSNLVHQQNLDGVDLCIITLHAVNSRYETLEPMVPDIRKAISKAKAWHGNSYRQLTCASPARGSCIQLLLVGCRRLLCPLCFKKI